MTKYLDGCGKTTRSRNAQRVLMKRLADLPTLSTGCDASAQRLYLSDIRQPFKTSILLIVDAEVCGVLCIISYNRFSREPLQEPWPDNHVRSLVGRFSFKSNNRSDWRHEHSVRLGVPRPLSDLIEHWFQILNHRVVTNLIDRWMREGNRDQRAVCWDNC